LAAPPPPDVPSGGLLVQGGSGSPDAGNTAFAALVYDVGLDSTVGRLSLTQASPSASTPGATLVVCPLLTASINPADGGPMTDAPKYDCKSKVTGKAQGAAPNPVTYQFDVASLVSNGTLAIAILPNDASTRVALNT